MEPCRAEALAQQPTPIRRKPLAPVARTLYATVSSSESGGGDTLEHTTSETVPLKDLSSRVEEVPEGLSLTANEVGSDKVRRHVFSQTRLWLPEGLSCLASIVTFGAIVAVLAWRSNKPLPVWYGGLTVNTLIALLATLCRAAIVVPVSEGISQLKWNWLAQKRRPLRDLKIFDEASRGPIASLRMGLSGRGGPLSVIAALVLTTGLAVSTFTQSAIILETHKVPSMNGSATARMLKSTPEDFDSVAQGSGTQQLARLSARLSSPEPKPIKGLTLADILLAFSKHLVLRTYQAIMGPVDKLATASEPTCSTSECQWAAFTSLGVCVELRNATKNLQINKTVGLRTTSTARLYDDAFFTVTKQGDEELKYFGKAVLVNISSPESPRGGTFKDKWGLRNASINYSTFIIYDTDDVESERFYAFEVVWHFCIQKYHLIVSQGRPSRKVESYTEIVDSGGKSAYNPWSPDTRFITLASEDGKENFTALWGRSRFGEEDKLPSNFASPLEDWISYGLQRNMTHGDKPLSDISTVLEKNLRRMAGSIATAMTNVFWEAGEPVQGTAFANVVFIRVNWAWLTFLAAQIILSSAFLIAVIVQTAILGVEVVKSSTIATMFAVDHNGNDAILVAERHSKRVPPGLRGELDKLVMGSLRHRERIWTVVVENDEVSGGGAV